MGTKHHGTAREKRALDAYIKLRRAANTLSALEAAALREARLTESQFGVLEALYHLGPLRQTDLASKLLCSAGNLTTVVDNLERDGLVERSAALSMTLSVASNRAALPVALTFLVIPWLA